MKYQCTLQGQAGLHAGSTNLVLEADGTVETDYSTALPFVEAGFLKEWEPPAEPVLTPEEQAQKDLAFAEEQAKLEEAAIHAKRLASLEKARIAKAFKAAEAAAAEEEAAKAAAEEKQAEQALDS